MSEHPLDCDHIDQHTLSIEQAKKKIQTRLKTVVFEETIPLAQAMGRILSQGLLAPVDVPSCNNSAMDGYAVNYHDALQHKGVLRCIGRALAGQAFRKAVSSGECVRIMTGACIPDNCDTVIMQEQIEINDDQITLKTQFKKGQNLRHAGEDIAKGSLVFSAGTKIMPPHMGVLASMGFEEIPVFEKLKVGLFSTGDELQALGSELQPGNIYDSNRYSLMAALSQLQVEIIDAGIIKDDRQAIRDCLQNLSQSCHLIITSGGVSVGEADYVKDELQSLGELHVWKIAMKPGKPLAFGSIGSTYFFGLPGNPVSVLATFYQFVMPAMKILQGENPADTLTFHVPCHGGLKKSAGRMEFQRGKLFYDAQGGLTVRSTGAQGSGILSSMAEANCFIVLPADTVRVEPGELVEVQVFYGLI